MSDGAAIFRDVMTVELVPATTPFQVATREFLFGDVWSRPGLGRRERRWVALTCAAAADAPKPLEDQVYAALKSGDMSLEELLEFVLHFAVYCGWPKASAADMAIAIQWHRLHQERGDEPPPWPELDNETLGENDWDQRIAR